MPNAPLSRQGPRVNERLARFCFIAVAVLFLLQWWFLGRSSEPYPALLMPSFAGVIVDADDVVSGLSADVTTNFSDGTHDTTSLDRLFADAPSSHRLFMSRIMFYPKDPPPTSEPAAVNSIKTWLKTHILPGLELGRSRRHAWQGVPPQTQQWLRTRLSDLYPGKNVKGATIIWYTNTYLRRDGQWEHVQTPTKSLEVPL